MGCNESKNVNRRLSDNETQDRSQLKPLTKIFKVEKLAGETQKPFCVYSFTINRTRATATSEQSEPVKNNKQRAPKSTGGANADDEDDKVAWRIKELVLDKALGEWLEKRKIEDRLYLIDMKVTRLYTQFVIERPKFVKGGDPECCMKRQITVQVPRLVGPKYVFVDESYDIALRTMGEPIRDLRNVAKDQVLQRAINFLLLADVSKERSYAVLQSKQNVGRIFNLSDERHKRVAELGHCLRSCRGLATFIDPDKTGAPGGGISLKLTEELSYFFSPVNMIQLLMAHFNFNVGAPLKRDEIDALKEELHNEVIEMRPGNLSNGDKSLPDVHVAEISDISQKSICEELCDAVDEKTGRFISQITVKEQFEREFPNVKLKFKHMPCLISAKGRRMPMEMCWIKPGEMLKHKFPSLEEKFDPDQLHRRTDIFEENCTEFTKRYRSTFKKFGFQLKPSAGVNQKVSGARTTTRKRTKAKV